MRNEYYRLACPCVLRLKDGDALWIHTTQGGAAAVSFFRYVSMTRERLLDSKKQQF